MKCKNAAEHYAEATKLLTEVDRAVWTGADVSQWVAVAELHLHAVDILLSFPSVEAHQRFLRIAEETS